MKQNSQFSDVLHVLLHMAEGDGPATSDMLAAALQTNPVVLRRLMSVLRDARLVTSAKGHGGGSGLSCGLDRITLRDAQEARCSPCPAALAFRAERAEDLVGPAVNSAPGDS